MLLLQAFRLGRQHTLERVRLIFQDHMSAPIQPIFQDRMLVYRLFRVLRIVACKLLPE